MSAGSIILGATGGGGLLRITSFTSSGTWTKQADVSKVLVFCVGGGGGGGGYASTGNGGNGGTSSFGSYCSASGGVGGLTSGGGGTPPRQGGAGGSTGVGDLILIGQSGCDATYLTNTGSLPGIMGGVSAVGGYGSGGRGGLVFTNSNSAAYNPTAGGGGACAVKLLTTSSLTSTVSVTIGSGGSTPSGGETGIQGIVFIYEYGY